METAILANKNETYIYRIRQNWDNTYCIISNKLICDNHFESIANLHSGNPEKGWDWGRVLKEFNKLAKKPGVHQYPYTPWFMPRRHYND